MVGEIDNSRISSVIKGNDKLLKVVLPTTEKFGLLTDG